MEKFVTLLIPALVALVLVRLLLMPMKLIFKVGIHSGCGFLCLWLLNSVAGFTGAYFPINAVTVLARLGEDRGLLGRVFRPDPAGQGRLRRAGHHHDLPPSERTSG